MPTTKNNAQRVGTSQQGFTPNMSATKLPPALNGTAKKYASEGRKGKHLIHNVPMINKLK